MLNKIAVILVFLSLFFTSCKKEKDNDQNLLFLILLGLNQSSGVTFSGNFGGVSSALGRATKALPEGITDVVAISAANHYHRSKVDANGNFSLGLVKGFNYIFVFIDSTNAVKGYYKLDSLSLNAIPTLYAGSEIKAGEIQKSTTDTSFSPVKNFNISEFKVQMGNLSDLEIDAMSTIGTQILQLSNIDSDGNGIIDLEENLYVRPFFFQGWGGGNNDPRFSLLNAQNQFFDMTFFSSISTGVGFGFAYDKAKITDRNLKITYPLPQGCTGNSGVLNVEYFPTDANLPTGRKGSTLALQIYRGLGNCGNTSLIPVSGTYIVENSGKTFTFKNMTPFIIKSDKTYVLPTVKFNTSGDKINSLEYKYIKLTPKGILDATSRDVELVYGISTYRSAGIICRDTVAGSSASWLFSCFIPKDKATGTVTSCQSGSFVKFNNPSSANFSQINNCNFYTYDDYGTYLGVDIFK